VSAASGSEAVLLDTNVLVYAFDEQSEFHGVSRALLAKAATAHPPELFCITPQILAEFFAVVTDSRRVRGPRTPQEAVEAIERLLQLPGLTLLPVPVDIVSRWTAMARVYPVRGPGVFDLQLVATMLANGVRKILTFDRGHFERLAEIEVLSPS